MLKVANKFYNIVISLSFILYKVNKVLRYNIINKVNIVFKAYITYFFYI